MLKHCRDKETAGSPFFREFASNRIPNVRKDFKYISSFTVEMSVNYTGEFRELFETTPYLGEFCCSHNGVIENSSLLSCNSASLVK